MKWIAISGSWRETSPKVQIDVKRIVSEIIKGGDGIVSGGALNVDCIATDTALKLNPKADKIKIFLPTTLKKYTKHYRKHAKWGNITGKQAEDLIAQLEKLKKISPKALVENPDENFTEKTKMDMYFDRNQKVIEAADKLIAFHVNESGGVAIQSKKHAKKGFRLKF